MLNSAVKQLERLARLGVHISALLIVIAMLAIVFNALFRYLLGGGFSLIIELSGFVFLVLIFFGIAGTYLAGGHVTVELVLDNLGPRTKNLFNRFIIPLVAIVYVGIIDYASFTETIKLFIDGETSIGRWTFLLWPFLAVMPIGCTLLLIALIAVMAGVAHLESGEDVKSGL